MNKKNQSAEIKRFIDAPGHLTLSNAPDGADALMLADLVRARQAKGISNLTVFIARDDAQAAAIGAALAFFAPDIERLLFPAWDCLPYDRVSPKSEILSQRMATLSALIHGDKLGAEAEGTRPHIILTTINAVSQKVPPRAMIESSGFSVAMGNILDLDALTAYLVRNGYSRSSTVREPGEFALRGGIVDLFAPGAPLPVRLDLFGDTLDAIRTFEPENQRSVGQMQRLDLVPVSEVPLDKASIARFRSAYVAKFGTVTGDDPLYEAVSEGRKFPGMEHWLPLFYGELATFYDFLPQETLVAMDHLVAEARGTRWAQIEDYYDARHDSTFGTGKSDALASTPYKALPANELYLDEAAWSACLDPLPQRTFTPFSVAPAPNVISAEAKLGRNFAPERQSEGTNVFDALAAHIKELQGQGKRTFVACWSHGSADRMVSVLSDHGISQPTLCATWEEAQLLPKSATGLLDLGLEHGIETETHAFIAEQDILGDRLVRPQRRSRKAANFISEAAALTLGDLVVHVEHGIGRYEGLETIEVSGAPHDCLHVSYQGGDKLFLPVENIELLSRYGADDSNAQLDKLGGTGWQARKSKLKERIREMAGQLIKVAAARALRRGEVIEPAHGLYDEFCARFPYEETEDQESAIADVLEDLESGRPMDRLICGDVGFGKTEVALRSAFVAVLAGFQVAIVTPTTLLCRQHYKTFCERFEGWPMKVRQLSRMVSTADARETKEALKAGDVDIVIGTHALLGKSVEFKNLGLLVIDEEQHFGVAHKERLKTLRSNVHVLTLSATPIPRTLQLAMSGVRELSLIATPPVDRLAVRTFITPFDPVVIREALLREHYRGGQSFYVCPRIADLPEAMEFLAEHVPELKCISAHGQMAPGRLDEIMNVFYDGEYDVLLSTTIVESGLDIPRANTLIIHRADMFGLAQLYQIRGRIGRSKVRAYAYLTVRPNRTLTANAEKRLKVLQSLDSLGAGFSLASHDLDIRGAGNLLGEEQSGHVKEVGLELYQNMLEDAVASLRDSTEEAEEEDRWSPQISVGTAVLIPENYVPDLDIRLSLYRRLSEVTTAQEMDGFAAELIDRFGPIPEEVEHLLEIVSIKGLCRRANVGKIDAGPKGAVVSFRKDEFPNPAGLIEYISQSPGEVKLRPDQKLVFKEVWSSPEARLKGVAHVLSILADIAAEASEAA